FFMTQAELREVWSTRINDYRASGERVATWCERHQVTPRQLWYWMRKLKGEDEPKQATNKPQWVPLQVKESTSDTASPLLVKVGSASIEIRSGFDPSLLADVVKVLKTLC
ncbi:hypothetical protein PMI08_05382, partial [Brevibacillus sp. CF112]